MDKQKVLKQIFDNAKDGDNLGFFNSGIKAKPIQIATNGDCTHCGKIWNVARAKNELSFNFSEQSFVGGQFNLVKIILKNGAYFAENYHRLNDSKKIYFRSLKKPLTKDQHKKGLDDAIAQIGKKYGYISLILGFSFFETIFPKWFRNRINIITEHSARVCSTHCAIQDSKMGLLVFKKEMFYSPIDIMNLDYYT